MPSARFLCSWPLCCWQCYLQALDALLGMWAQAIFLHVSLGMPGFMASQWLLFCPLASKIGLALCHLLFRNWFSPALWVLVLVWFHLSLEELNYLLTATAPVNGRPGIETQMEKETTPGDLMLWDEVSAEEEERFWEGKVSKGLTCHPFQVSQWPPWSCGHNQKQYFRKCSKIWTSKKKIVPQRSPPRYTVLFEGEGKDPIILSEVPQDKKPFRVNIINDRKYLSFEGIIYG